MQLYTIGVNHTTAPISIREQVAFTDANLRHALNDLTAKNAIEAAINIQPMILCKPMHNGFGIGWLHVNFGAIASG